MDPFEKLQSQYHDKIYIFDRSNLPKDFKGLYIKIKDQNIILLSKSIETTVEKLCILAEEIGHYETTVGNILDQTERNNSKQERQARAWGYEKLVSLENLIRAYQHECQDIYEMADFLEVSDEFFQNAIRYYKDKYGEFTACGEYLLFFDPIFKIIEQE